MYTPRRVLICTNGVDTCYVALRVWNWHGIVSVGCPRPACRNSAVLLLLPKTSTGLGDVTSVVGWDKDKGLVFAA